MTRSRSRASAQVLLAVLAIFATACGPQPGISSQSPSGDQATDDVCRPPLGDDEQSPIGRAARPHQVFSDGSGEWWSSLAQSLMEDHADQTAGMWLDQEAGEVVVMTTADDPAALLEQLRDEVGDEHADRVVCMRADHTHDELTDLLDQVSARLQEVQAPGSRALDTVRNRIEVEYETDLDAIEEALGELAEHPAVQLSRPACAEVADLPADAIPLPGDGSTCVGMDALATGTLTGEVEDGCLWLEHEQGEMTIVWPRGWWVSPGGVVHDHHGDARAQLGEQVHAGGGGGQHAGDAVPAECRVSDEVWILSSLDPA